MPDPRWDALAPDVKLATAVPVSLQLSPDYFEQREARKRCMRALPDLLEAARQRDEAVELLRGVVGSVFDAGHGDDPGDWCWLHDAPRKTERGTQQHICTAEDVAAFLARLDAAEPSEAGE